MPIIPPMGAYFQSMQNMAESTRRKKKGKKDENNESLVWEEHK